MKLLFILLTMASLHALPDPLARGLDNPIYSEIESVEMLKEELFPGIWNAEALYEKEPYSWTYVVTSTGEQPFSVEIEAIHWLQGKDEVFTCYTLEEFRQNLCDEIEEIAEVMEWLDDFTYERSNYQFLWTEGNAAIVRFSGEYSLSGVHYLNEIFVLVELGETEGRMLGIDIDLIPIEEPITPEFVNRITQALKDQRS